MSKHQSGELAGIVIGSDGGLSQCRWLQTTILDSIPLARAMQLQVSRIDRAGGLHLSAPLAPNVNDKGSAFGGAIGSMLALAGWGWLQLANQSTGISQHVVIQRNQGLCQRPCYGALSVVCPAPAERDWQCYVRAYRRFSRARLRLQPVLLNADGSVASRMVAEYVAALQEDIK